MPGELARATSWPREPARATAKAKEVCNHKGADVAARAHEEKCLTRRAHEGNEDGVLTRTAHEGNIRGGGNPAIVAVMHGYILCMAQH